MDGLFYAWQKKARETPGRGGRLCDALSGTDIGKEAADTGTRKVQAGYT